MQCSLKKYEDYDVILIFFEVLFINVISPFLISVVSGSSVVLVCPRPHFVPFAQIRKDSGVHKVSSKDNTSLA
jgi:hypothetical protein